LSGLSKELARDLSNKNLSGKTVTLKVKYADFQQITRSKSFQQSINDYKQIYTVCKKLLLNTEAGKRKVRLLGVGISSFNQQQSGGMIQLELDLSM